MRTHKNVLLLVDGIVNLLLGILLLLFPTGLADALGLPSFQDSFYPTILGAVLFGIGIALLVEQYGRERGVNGLGVAGAIAINICAGGALLLWLVVGDLGIPLKGRVILWALATVVLLIAVAEAASRAWRQRGDTA